MTRPEALARMQALVGRTDIEYILGGVTMTQMDCFGAAVCYAYGIKRHEPGANRGPWATVSDDWNCNSAIEDSEHRQQRFIPVAADDIEPGDLIMYPTIHLPGHPLPWIGHVQMVEHVPAGWTLASGYCALEIIHCHGPNGRRPAVTRGNGYACDRHDEQWGGEPLRRTRLIRVR
jgi:hypothetical protein